MATTDTSINKFEGLIIFLKKNDMQTNRIDNKIRGNIIDDKVFYILDKMDDDYTIRDNIKFTD